MKTDPERDWERRQERREEQAMADVSDYYEQCGLHWDYDECEWMDEKGEIVDTSDVD